MVETVAATAAVLFVLLALFQLALALGVPWGAHAYGGRMVEDDGSLPTKWRISSAVAALILLGFAWVILARAGVLVVDINELALTVMAWMVVAYMAINTAANLASHDPVERWLMGSTTLVLVVLCSIVAAAGPS